jgi:flagellar biosynthesis anti-sigma factor FlgM
MQVNGLTSVHGAQAINAPHSIRPNAPPAARPAVGGDELQISSQGQILSRIADLPEVRQERIDQLRAAIADGSYESGARLETAVQRLLDEIG